MGDELSGLLADLASLEDKLNGLEQQKAAIREQISYRVSAMGGKVTIPGYGSLSITEPTILATYSRETIESYAADLKREGSPEIAEQLLSLGKRSMRAGSLVIRKERKKEEAA